MYLIVSNGFFVVGRPFLIGILPGLVAGLLIDDPILSAVAGANSIAFGFLLSPPAAVQASDGRTWMLTAGLIAIVVAALIAAVATLTRKAGVKAWILGLLGVAIALGAMWYGATTIAGSAALSGDAPLIAALEAPVQPYRRDDRPRGLPVRASAHEAGVSYNEAWGEIITALGSRYEQSAPVKYRLPTLQWLWNVLPASAWSLVSPL